jgi:predicted methyltransferase
MPVWSKFAAAALVIMAAGTFAVPACAAKPKAAVPAAVAVDPALTAALADSHRDKDRARDVYRHPAQMLSFMKIKPGMTVVEYYPGGGWFTRVLVPYLGDKGHYIGLIPPVTPAGAPGEAQTETPTSFAEKAAKWTGNGGAPVSAIVAGGKFDDMKGKADRVVIFRGLHNMWSYIPTLHADLKAARLLLKPDGLLGVEQHRAKPGASADYADGTMGYMREKDVIALLDAMGFQLVGKSEMNANPKDPANWPDGVWTLPPAYTLGDKDRARYAAIGESDRMTLLFRKRP